MFTIKPQSINILDTTIPVNRSAFYPQLTMDTSGPVFDILPKSQYRGPPEIISIPKELTGPLMKPAFQNYNETQKRRLKAFVDVKLQVVNKKAKLADLQGVGDDLRYKSVTRLFNILDKLSTEERKKLRDYLEKSLGQVIPITKRHESTGALVKALIDMRVMFDETTTYTDIQNDLLWISKFLAIFLEFIFRIYY
jgi:hypothetical protein